MPGDFRTYLIMLAVGGALIFSVSLLPPLTSGTVSVAKGVSQAEFQAAVSQEMTYCEERADNLDCQCFADISGYVVANKRAAVPFTRSIDQTVLARRQAEESC